MQLFIIKYSFHNYHYYYFILLSTKMYLNNKKWKVCQMNKCINANDQQLKIPSTCLWHRLHQLYLSQWDGFYFRMGFSSSLCADGPSSRSSAAAADALNETRDSAAGTNIDTRDVTAPPPYWIGQQTYRKCLLFSMEPLQFTIPLFVLWKGRWIISFGSVSM